MSGAGRGESKGRAPRRITEIAEEEYKPPHRPERSERSPYLTRAAEITRREPATEEEADSVEEEAEEQMEEGKEVAETPHKRGHTKKSEGVDVASFPCSR